MKPIFIVGCARTGSKLHADILNGHSQLNLVDELHYLAPWWLRRDFARAAASAGALKHDNNLSELLDQMYSGRLDIRLRKMPRRSLPFWLISATNCWRSRS